MLDPARVHPATGMFTTNTCKRTWADRCQRSRRCFWTQLHIPAKFYDQKLDRHYEVYSRDGKLYQSEFALDPTGKESFRDTHQIQWLVGSGANSIGGIVRRDHYLFEAPLTLYTKPMTWASSPGYEFADYSFSRPILEGCIFCHSGRANPVPGTNGRYRVVAFSELAIGCENCHGPGAKHIEAVKSGRSVNESAAIVNPARAIAGTGKQCLHAVPRVRR